jgi:hypothetical protein
MNIIEIASFDENGHALDSNGEKIIIRNNTKDHVIMNGTEEVDKVVAVVTIIND